MTMDTELPISLLKKDLIILELRAELAEASRVIASYQHREVTARLMELERAQREPPAAPEAERQWLTDGDI